MTTSAPQLTPLAQQLDAYLAAHAGARFDWGRLNCCHFAARWVELATGATPMRDMPATPDWRAALRLIGTLGGTLDAAVTRRLGRTPIAPALAQLGDIVLAPIDEGGAAVGICNGRASAFLTEHDGLAFVPTDCATHAWRLRAEGDA